MQRETRLGVGAGLSCAWRESPGTFLLLSGPLGSWTDVTVLPKRVSPEKQAQLPWQNAELWESHCGLVLRYQPRFKRGSVYCAQWEEGEELEVLP